MRQAAMTLMITGSRPEPDEVRAGAGAPQPDCGCQAGAGGHVGWGAGCVPHWGCTGGAAFQPVGAGCCHGEGALGVGASQAGGETGAGASEAVVGSDSPGRSPAANPESEPEPGFPLAADHSGGVSEPLLSWSSNFTLPGLQCRCSDHHEARWPWSILNGAVLRPGARPV